MRLTTKGRFAVTAMVDLALRQSGGPATLNTKMFEYLSSVSMKDLVDQQPAKVAHVLKDPHPRARPAVALSA